MGRISISKMWIASFDDSCEDYTYSDFATYISEDEIRQYEKKKPFPKSKTFDLEELISYNSNGSRNVLCFTKDVNYKVISWIEDMLNYFYAKENDENFKEEDYI